MIRILTDSASDITPRQAVEMGIDLVSLTIRFPSHAYDQQSDEDFHVFYTLLQSEKEFPTTSQPPPEPFVKVFEEAKAAGDSVLAILLSSGLSGTVQSAQIAKDTVGYDNVHIIDSRSAIMPLRAMVEYAVGLRDAGEPLDRIVERVMAIRDRSKIYGMLDTLTYLHKGGRLPRTVAIAGNLLHIKPVITLKNGVIGMSGRGRNFGSLLKLFAEDDFDPDFPVYFGYTWDATNCQKMMNQALEQFPIQHTGIFPLGGVIGAHVGPGAMAISYVKKK